jgi:hypothetical protein
MNFSSYSISTLCRFKTCSVNPKMQNGHYPEYECFIAKKSNEYKHKSKECKHEKRGK